MKYTTILTILATLLVAVAPLSAQDTLRVKHLEGVDIHSRKSLEKAFGSVEYNPIDKNNWPEEFPYTPKAGFKIFHLGEYLCLRYEVEENNTAATRTVEGSDVCMDSCVEFFISPEGNTRFYNFETSCIGTTHYAHRLAGTPQTFAPKEVLDEILRYPSLGKKPFERREGDCRWSLIIVLPIRALYADHFSSWGELGSARANFYSCGDALSPTHFLSWGPILTPKKKAHAPQFFRPIVFE